MCHGEKPRAVRITRDAFGSIEAGLQQARAHFEVGGIPSQFFNRLGEGPPWGLVLARFRGVPLLQDFPIERNSLVSSLFQNAD